MSNLQPYVDHLLEDIKQAWRTPIRKPAIVDDDESFEQQIREVEAYLDQTSYIPLEKTCGLDSNSFPAVDLLTQDQQLQMINAIHEMLNSWNIQASIPEKVPSAMAYNLLLGILKEGFPRMQHGQYVYDFCTGVPDGCELGEYCPCLEFYKDTKNEELGREQD